MPMGRGDEVGFDREIVANEISREFVVCQDAADARGGDEDVFGFFDGKEGLGGLRVGQVELGMRAGDEVRVAGCGQCSAQGRPDQAAVAGDVNTGIGGHEG